MEIIEYGFGWVVSYYRGDFQEIKEGPYTFKVARERRRDLTRTGIECSTFMIGRGYELNCGDD